MPTDSKKNKSILPYILLGLLAILFLVYIFNSKDTTYSTSPIASPPSMSLPRPSPSQIQNLRNNLKQWRDKNCPVCQSAGRCTCPSPRPTMADAQNTCAGMDPSQGVPYTAECINAIFAVYGCNPRYPDPNTSPNDISYNASMSSFNGVNQDAFAWSTLPDDAHRNGCYAPGGIPW